MKKFIFTIILSVFMISCASFSKKGKEVNYAKKNLESGNYYEAIINYSNALIIDYDYKPAIKGSEIHHRHITKCFTFYLGKLTF